MQAITRKLPFRKKSMDAAAPFQLIPVVNLLPARRRVSLIPQSARSRAYVTRGLLAAAVLLLLFLAQNFYTQTNRDDDATNAAQVELSTVLAVQEQIEELEEELEVLAQRQVIMQEDWAILTRQPEGLLEAMRQVLISAPADVSIDSVQTTGEAGLTIQGSTTNPSSPFSWSGSLETADSIDRVVNLSSSPLEGGGFRFNMTLQVAQGDGS